MIIESPKNSDAPKTPSSARVSFTRRVPPAPSLVTTVISAMMPPSPSLSARITSSTYVMVTMIIPDQKISEMTPNTLSADTFTGCGSPGLNSVCTVYSGLVPISPNTTPSAPSASAARPPPCLSSHGSPYRTRPWRLQGGKPPRGQAAAGPAGCSVAFPRWRLGLPGGQAAGVSGGSG